MTIENLDTLTELFTRLLERQSDSRRLDPQYIIQLQGQVEESLGLLNDVIDELRIIDPQSVSTLKSLTLQIFDEDSDPSQSPNSIDL